MVASFLTFSHRSRRKGAEAPVVLLRGAEHGDVDLGPGVPRVELPVGEDPVGVDRLAGVGVGHHLELADLAHVAERVDDLSSIENSSDGLDSPDSDSQATLVIVIRIRVYFSPAARSFAAACAAASAAAFSAFFFAIAALIWASSSGGRVELQARAVCRIGEDWPHERDVASEVLGEHRVRGRLQRPGVGPNRCRGRWCLSGQESAEEGGLVVDRGRRRDGELGLHPSQHLFGDGLLGGVEVLRRDLLDQRHSCRVDPDTAGIRGGGHGALLPWWVPRCSGRCFRFPSGLLQARNPRRALTRSDQPRASVSKSSTDASISAIRVA